MMCRLASLFALSAVVSAQPPLAMQELCKDHIVTWSDVPHDWMEERSDWRGDGNGRFLGKDWWYWNDDWKSKISDGDVDMEPRLNEEFQYKEDGKPLLGKCGNGAEVISSIPNVDSTGECRLYCAFEYSTQGDVREKCQFFSYDSGSGDCLLYAQCGWPYDDSQNNGGVDLDDENCYGEDRSDCSWDADATVWRTYRIVDIYPAGFQSFSLREFNQPPLCIHVPASSDKKVEVMIETEMNDSRICIMDGRDMGVYTNDVGNVRTCDNGKLYSCFTAASARSGTNNGDFYFYISCEGSCEASDVDVWIRLRKSELSWDDGKKDWENDIEYWCENERATKSGVKASDDVQHSDFTYPSELLPDEPRDYPFRINKGMLDSSAGAFGTIFACAVALITALALL